ncbi:MAG: DUF21 domain-containing protein [Gammaproteobacteria bacterium]|nr:DUF21 domain-containing protein [Gammaproteobacteria bacterium]
MSEIANGSWLVWLGIIFCISQSAMFSGLNLALIGIGRLRLEVESASGNKAAQRILQLRQDANFLLTTILWGNVGINVLLTMLSNSVLAGLSAFLFSTGFITFFGEIAPQAYFSRNALKTGSLLAPILKIYQIILYPVAKPSALILDWILGPEGIPYFRERDIRNLIHQHIEANESDITRLEGIGAMNFLELDDLLVTQEGELVDPLSVVTLPHKGNTPVFPAFIASREDPFIESVSASGKKWVIFADMDNNPTLVVNTNEFLRAVFFEEGPVDILRFCHRPIIVKNTHMMLGSVLSNFVTSAGKSSDAIKENDLVLVWADQRRVITGTDILERLLQGVSISHVRRAFIQ